MNIGTLDEVSMRAEPMSMNDAQAASGESLLLSSQISNLVSSVFFSDERKLGEKTRVIAVTAPISGEGTTTIARLMARELARSDRLRSLLVSAEALEALQPRHLTNFDAEWVPSSTQTYWVSSANLADPLATKGPWSKDLAFRRRVLEELHRLFDNVVIDCRPVRKSNDIALLSPLIDGFVLVVRSGGSTQTQVRQAVEIVRLSEGEVKGCCFNARKYPIPSRIYRFFKR